MTFPKKLTSNVIAAIGTVIIHILLFGALSLGFRDEQSSHASDDDIVLEMEELAAEDISITPPGRDPLSDRKDQSSESISKTKGAIKPPSSSTTPAPQQNSEPEAVVTPPDTVIQKIEVVQAVKVDTVKATLIQDSVIAEIIKKTQPAKQKTVTSRFRNEHEKLLFYQKNYRSIRNFKKVYPYALKTREIIENLNKQLATMKNEADKKKLIKETEQMLFKEYESAVRTMTTSQGRLLLKLIARETNKTGYDIIKDYKGGFSASFWYGVGKLFGTDLKSEYHKENEDSLIENVLDKYQKNDLY